MFKFVYFPSNISHRTGFNTNVAGRLHTTAPGLHTQFYLTAEHGIFFMLITDTSKAHNDIWEKPVYTLIEYIKAKSSYDTQCTHGLSSTAVGAQ